MVEFVIFYQIIKGSVENRFIISGECHQMPEKLRLGVLISGTGTNLKAVLKSCEAGTINAKIVFVGSDNPRASGLKVAQARQIPTFVVDYASIIRKNRQIPYQCDLPADFNLDHMLSKQTLFSKATEAQKLSQFFISRVSAEAQLLDKMRAYPFDLLILAGFMRNLTPYLIDKINIDPQRPRIMNIHPALLPAFPGTDGYGDTFRYGCKVAGCTVHFVDYGEDSGPIIGQRAFPIREGDRLEDVRRKGFKWEWDLYSECIQLFAENRLRIENQKYRLASGREISRKVVKILP